MSDAILSFLIAVAGGVTCHYIIKWLDSDDKAKRKPQSCRSGVFAFANMSLFFVLPTGIIHHIHWDCQLCE